jgi:hypothetical protein
VASARQLADSGVLIQLLCRRQLKSLRHALSLLLLLLPLCKPVGGRLYWEGSILPASDMGLHLFWLLLSLLDVGI